MAGDSNSLTLGQGLLTGAGNAATDLLSGIGTDLGDQIKAQGLEAEAENYTIAAEYTGEEENVAATNMAVQEYQAGRTLALAQGKTQSEVAAAGFENSGSALDILSSNAQQGATQQAVAEVNGENQIAGLKEQQQTYQNLAQYATQAAGETEQQGNLAEITGMVGAAFQGLGAVASLGVLAA